MTNHFLRVLRETPGRLRGKQTNRPHLRPRHLKPARPSQDVMSGENRWLGWCTSPLVFGKAWRITRIDRGMNTSASRFLNKRLFLGPHESRPQTHFDEMPPDSGNKIAHHVKDSSRPGSLSLSLRQKQAVFSPFLTSTLSARNALQTSRSTAKRPPFPVFFQRARPGKRLQPEFSPSPAPGFPFRGRGHQLGLLQLHRRRLALLARSPGAWWTTLGGFRWVKSFFRVLLLGSGDQVTSGRDRQTVHELLMCTLK